MPLNCPHCQIAQAEGNKTCINCGRSLTSAAPAPPPADAPVPAGLPPVDPAAHDSPAPMHVPTPAVPIQRASRRLPALLAVGLLLALTASAFLVARHRLFPRAPLAAHAPVQTPNTIPPAPVDAGVTVNTPPPADAPQVAAPPVTIVPPAPARAAAPPLAVSLASTGEGRHVKVGDAVTFTAFTTLEHGHSATLTLFARRGRAPKAMFAFVQGSLCSTLWTAPSPGRYEFTATALGDRRQTAVSSRIEITVDKPAVDKPAAPRVASAVVRETLPPRKTAAKPTPPKRAAHAKPAAPVSTYYVAAAQFFYSRSADVLAAALSHRGYKAIPERMTDPRGRPVYVVVTGSYRRPSEARSAALALQRSGYPAYFFGSR